MDDNFFFIGYTTFLGWFLPLRQVNDDGLHVQHIYTSWLYMKPVRYKGSIYNETRD